MQLQIRLKALHGTAESEVEKDVPDKKLTHTIAGLRIYHYTDTACAL